VILAIDTSTRTGSIALIRDGVVAAHRALDDDKKHGSMLAPAIASLEGFDPAAVDAYAITIGPGSFTGLRIGLAFLKGVALVHPRPVIPVSTLEVIAEALLAEDPTATHALPILDARRQEVYAALYARGRAAGEDLAIDPRLPEQAYAARDIAGRVPVDPALRIISAGDGVPLAAPLGANVVRADPPLGVPDARILGRIAWRRRQRGEGVDVMALEPAYHQRSPGEAGMPST
jgi:tRNA threonylcarbamoyladenosine biosynthesis protein TsaB